jgi:hypothetical protein
MSFLNGERRTRGGIVTLVFTALGSGLWLQPERWARTPSYGLLLNLADQQWWGSVHLVIAVLMCGYIVWPTCRKLAVVAHTAAFTVVAVWLVAFVIRYITDDATTIVNVVSWSAYLYLVIRSLLLIDGDPLEEAGDTTAGPR